MAGKKKVTLFEDGSKRIGKKRISAERTVSKVARKVTARQAAAGRTVSKNEANSRARAIIQGRVAGKKADLSRFKKNKAPKQPKGSAHYPVTGGGRVSKR